MKLIILNGPSGIGKSTIALELKRALPDAILLDVDEMRRQIPNYRERRAESLKLVYEQAVAATQKHLTSGYDVIIDKSISSSAVLDSLLAAGRECGAEVFEFLLFADKEALQTRADARGYRPGSLLTRERVGEMWDEINTLRTSRPDARSVDTTTLTLGETVSTIKHILRI